MYSKFCFSQLCVAKSLGDHAGATLPDCSKTFDAQSLQRTKWHISYSDGTHMCMLIKNKGTNLGA